MKKSILFLAVLLTACAQVAPARVEELPDVSVAPAFESSRETTIAEGSSELKDDTGYGFAYSAANVLDLDYSTAWCPNMAEDAIPVLTLNFPEPTKLSTVGIVGGFARDEDIFFKNSRLKTVEVWYDDQPEALGELHFEDKYEMQFFQMPEDSVKSVKFKVMEVYSGSKYKDTCVAEIDFWSGWVSQKDAVAAVNYYEEYKASSSIRPVGVDKVDIIFAREDLGVNVDDLTLDCGQIDMTNVIKQEWDGGFDYLWKYDIDKHEIYGDGSHEFLGRYSDGWWNASSGESPILSVLLNNSAKEEDVFTVKWIQTGFILPGFIPVLVEEKEIKPKVCEDGSLYLSDALSKAGAATFRVEVYYGSKLITSQIVSLAQ